MGGWGGGLREERLRIARLGGWGRRKDQSLLSSYTLVEGPTRLALHTMEWGGWEREGKEGYTLKQMKQGYGSRLHEHHSLYSAHARAHICKSW